MLYLAIDQHKSQLTMNIRNEHGEVIQKGQFSTKPADIDRFFVDFTKKSRKHRGFMAILEVCGFNNWLLEKLEQHQCNEIVVVQPNTTALNKTDKRDADALGALLWNNRKRLQGGQRPHGIRRIFPADPADAQVRQLANFRQHLTRQRTMVINKIKGIVNKHNPSHDAPTENSATQKFRKWIQAVQLPVVDRIEVDMNIKALELYDKQIIEIESELVKRAEASKETRSNVYRLNAIPGISSCMMVLVSFPRGNSQRWKRAVR
jgi:hypothetical protein